MNKHSRSNAARMKLRDALLAVSLLLAIGFLLVSLHDRGEGATEAPRPKLARLDSQTAQSLLGLEWTRAAVARDGAQATSLDETQFNIIEFLSREQHLDASIIEVQRAYAPATFVWALWRDVEGRPARIERLYPEQSVRGASVTLPRSVRQGAFVLVAATNLGKQQPKFQHWSLTRFREFESANRDLRSATYGIFIVLAIFSLVIAWVSRAAVFLSFSGWSLTSLRTISVNEGWATSWLHGSLPAQVINPALGVTLILHLVFSLALFASLFEAQVQKGWSGRLLKGFALANCLTAAVAVLAPLNTFYPIAWTLAGFAMAYAFVSIAILWARHRSRVLAWYTLFWAVNLIGLSSEIVYTSGVAPYYYGILGARNAAILGALIMAVTLAEHFYRERAERQRAQSAELVAKERLAHLYNSVPIGLFRMNQDGIITVANETFNSMFAREEATGSAESASDVLGVEVFNELMARLKRSPSGLTDETIESRSPQQHRFLSFTVRTHLSAIEGSIQDVTQRVDTERQLERLIDHDPLTGALNQRGLDDAVRNAIAASRLGDPAAIIDLDIDRFKTFNELYGYLAGDDVLKSVYERLFGQMGSQDIIARIGDSFRIVTQGRSPGSLQEFSARLHRSIGFAPYSLSGRLLSVTSSVGVVPIDPSMTVRDAISASSQACAEAKSSGRNRIRAYGEHDRTLDRYLEELKVQANLCDKIQSDRFFLEFQPIVSVRRPFDVLNYEVLVRMRAEDGSTITPDRFIPAAERNGQMSLIDRWVLETTLQWLDQNRGHLARLDYATINLSGSSLNDARFVNDAIALISEHPEVGRKLCFEITETIALADRNATLHFCDRIHSLGARVALDDFGAGYTSFTYLKEIEADVIKVDGSFVRDIYKSAPNHAITRTIVQLAHELGKQCVAECAEQPEVIMTLMSLEVDYIQGFALSRPISPDAILLAGSSGDLIVDSKIRGLLAGRSLSRTQSILGQS